MNFLKEFQNPSSRFRGAPFWAWNCKLNQEQLLRQLEHFHRMGLGGATIHSRIGLDTPYLGEEFMSLVEACVKRAEELKMKIYLYDEDRWPSGFGGGEVTKNKDYRARYLVFTKESPEEIRVSDKGKKSSFAMDYIQGDGDLIARYEVTLTKGVLTGYRRLTKEEEGDNVWYAYREIKENNPWYNDQAYADTLNKEAIECFINTTHEKYAAALGDKFGGIIPSIFTDEPQFTHKMNFGRAEDTDGIIIPFTDDFEETFQKTYGESFLEHLPEIFWELPGGTPSAIRYHYHDHIAERFATAFSDTIGNWCREHHIALTGHLMEEPTLDSQTRALGEAMRHYRGFQIPGIDILCDIREFTTAKQAQSAAHQMGCPEITSELYGVTNWDFDFRGHKQQGDWQAALGVTHRVHHLSWVSMEGEAKRDYPASISYQSPWSEKYSIIEDYFARLGTALISGKPHVRIGVIHPIESYWLLFGPDEQTKIKRDKLERQFAELTEWLLFGLMDFDFISESLWNSLGSSETGQGARVGEMDYEVLIIPGLNTYRSSTIKRLKNFTKRGGKVIFMGTPGRYVDAVESDQPEKLAKKGTQITYDETELMNALLNYRDIEMFDRRGVRSKRYIYQMREDGDNRILFIANALKNENQDIPLSETYRIIITGNYRVELLDAMSGERKVYPFVNKKGKTELQYTFYEEDSLLLYLTAEDAASEEQLIDTEKKVFHPVEVLNTVKGYVLSEPNVLMLDQAEYSLDDEAFAPAEEVLRIDNLLRERLNYPLKMDAYAQPWTENNRQEEAKHKLTLRYLINSELNWQPVRLALETPANMKLTWNGKQVEIQKEGYYVDESIHIYRLPGIKKGVNELVLEMDYNRWSNLEWCYLLGDFGVYVYGNKTTIVPQKDEIGFGNLTTQGFPFYGGNVTYQCEVMLQEGEYALEAAKFRSPLLSVRIDGREAGSIFASPYTTSLGYLAEGVHLIEIISYGNRINTFGTVHNCNENNGWFSPESWRTKGTQYSYEYQLKQTGILAAPTLYRT
ncbi:MAG: glycosyl hydrolase [Mobilitalea sp.]